MCCADSVAYQYVGPILTSWSKIMQTEHVFQVSSFIK